MPCHILCNAAGDIEIWDTQPFPGSVEVDYEVVRGWDGRLYKAGEEPAAPIPTLSDAKTAQRKTINAGFDAAMTASLTMPSASTPPSAFSVYQAIETWKADDPEGFNTLLAIHTARRDTMLASVDAATSVEAVQAITVTYAV